MNTDSCHPCNPRLAYAAFLFLVLSFCLMLQQSLWSFVSCFIFASCFVMSHDSPQHASEWFFMSALSFISHESPLQQPSLASAASALVVVSPSFFMGHERLLQQHDSIAQQLSAGFF